MIDFTTVSREFRSLVNRRRELLTFLGSVFAAMGIFLQNVLKGSLPSSLENLSQHVFAFYAVMLLAPSLILALRIARLHGGMVLNGILYAKLMETQEFTRKANPFRAARHNFLGVSFLLFMLADIIAGFAAAILGLAIGLAVWMALGLGLLVVLVWLFLYLRFHHNAARFALGKIKDTQCASFDINEWQAHVSGSLEDVNHDMIGVIAFVGLIVFSVFESLSGLGEIAARNLDLARGEVQQYGPHVLAWLMVITCVMGLAIYIRLRIAVGAFSLQADPTDKPFRPFRLTDSLLGYVLVAFLFGVSIFVLFNVYCPHGNPALQLASGIAAGAFAILAEQVAVVIAGAKMGQS